MTDKTSGWIQLIMAGVAAFAQIWSMIHGMSLDPSHAAATIAIAANGAHHVGK